MVRETRTRAAEIMVRETRTRAAEIMVRKTRTRAAEIMVRETRTRAAGFMFCFINETTISTKVIPYQSQDDLKKFCNTISSEKKYFYIRYSPNPLSLWNRIMVLSPLSLSFVLRL